MFNYNLIKEIDLVFGWVDNRHRIDDLILQGISQNLTDAWTQEIIRTYKTDIYCDKDIDNLLHTACNNNHNFILILAIGNNLDGEQNFIISLIELLNNIDINQLTIIGHILDRKEFFYELHDQIILINLKWWIKAGKPVYGSAFTKDICLTSVNRSIENWHDDYTPHWIESQKKEKKYKGGRQGWNILNYALQENKKIYSWNGKCRNSKNFLYPTSESNVNDAINKINITSVFLGNTESNSRIDFNRLPFNNFEYLAVPAAGLSPLILAFLTKLKEGSTICIFDISKDALKYQKRISNMHLDLNHIKDNLLQIQNSMSDISFIGVRTLNLFQDIIRNHIKDGILDYYKNVWPTLQKVYVHADIYLTYQHKRIYNTIPNDLKYGFLHLSNIYAFKEMCLFNSAQQRRIVEYKFLKGFLNFYNTEFYVRSFGTSTSQSFALLDDYLSILESNKLSDELHMLPWHNND